MTPMTEVPPEDSVLPKIRLEQKPSLNREGPSIDAIMRRTHPDNVSSGSHMKIGMNDYFDSLEQEEMELREKQRELARKQAEADERVRAVRETEILLEAREKLLDNREAVMAKRNPDMVPDQQIAALEQSLKETRNALKEANEKMARKRDLVAELSAEIEELKVRGETQVHAGEGSQPEGYDAVTHVSLAEQVAFLREREAFIEQSENTLFDKAQELQEWEARLQQMQHDSGSDSQRMAG